MYGQNRGTHVELSLMDLIFVQLLGDLFEELTVGSLIQKNSSATQAVFGDPASLEDFLAVVQRADGLTNDVKSDIVRLPDTCMAFGWRFVSNSATGEAKVYKGQLAVVLEVDQLTQTGMACSLENFFTPRYEYFVVKPGDLTNIRPV